MGGHEGLLSTIGISGETKERLIDTAITHFNNCKKTITEEIEQNKYSGKDQLDLTLPLIKELKVELSLSDNLNDLLELNPEEIKALCDSPDIIEQISHQLGDPGSLVIFAVEAPLAKFKTVLSLAASILSEYVINSAKSYVEVIAGLDNERMQVFFDIWKDKLPEFIKSVEDFSLFEYLTPEQRDFVYERVKEKLPEINEARDLNGILKPLNNEQRAEIYAKLEDRIPELAHSVKELGLVMEHLTPPIRTSLYQMKKEILEDIDYTGNLGMILKFLPLAEFTELKNKKRRLIDSARDFKHVIAPLSPEQRTLIYEDIKEELPTFISNYIELRKSIRFLNKEQAQAVLDGLKKQGKTVITGVDGFRSVLTKLNPELRAVVYEDMRDKLPEMINSIEDCNSACIYLTPQQYAPLWESYLEKYPINTAEDFASHFSQLRENLKPLAFESLKSKLLDFITDTASFNLIFSSLGNAQKATLFESIKTNLPEIKTPKEFEHIIQYLNPAQQKVVYEKVQASLLPKIKTLPELISVVRKLNQEQFNSVWQYTNSQPNPVISNAHDLFSFLSWLAPNQRAPALSVMNDQLKKLLLTGTGSDLISIFHLLLAPQRQIVIEKIFDDLPKVIKTMGEFFELIPLLHQGKQRNDFVEKMVSSLPNLINSYAHLTFALDELSVEQGVTLLSSLENRDPPLTLTVNQFTHVIYNRPSKVANALITTFAEKFPGMLNYQFELVNLLQSLTAEQKITIFEHIKTKMVEIITTYEHREVFDYLSLEQTSTICGLLNENKPELIKTSEEFIYFIGSRRLKTENKNAIINALLENVVKVVQDLTDFKKITNVLNTNEQFVNFCEKIGKKQPPIKMTTGEFISTLGSLDSSKRDAFLQASRLSFPSMVQTPENFIDMFSSLNPEEIPPLFKQIEKNLPQVMGSTNTFVNTIHYLSKTWQKAIYEVMSGKKLSAFDNKRMEEYWNTLVATTQIKGSANPDILVKEAHAKKQENLKAPLNKFILTLYRHTMEDDANALKTQFDQLIRLANTHRSKFFTRGNTKSCTQLINNLANMGSDEKEKLNKLLHLKLSDEKVNTPSSFKKALESYVKNMNKPDGNKVHVQASVNKP